MSTKNTEKLAASLLALEKMRTAYLEMLKKNNNKTAAINGALFDAAMTEMWFIHKSEGRNNNAETCNNAISSNSKKPNQGWWFWG